MMLFFLKDAENDTDNILEILKKYSSEIKVFKTKSIPLNLEKFNLRNKFIAFSGIGNPQNFSNILLQNKFNIVEEFIFADHHEYSTNELKKIKEKAKLINADIITTEKDYFRISEKDRSGIDYLEIDLKIEHEKDLINFLKLSYMNNVKYFIQFLIIILLFAIFKILGLKISTFISQWKIIFKLFGPLFRSKKTCDSNLTKAIS